MCWWGLWWTVSNRKRSPFQLIYVKRSNGGAQQCDKSRDLKSGRGRYQSTRRSATKRDYHVSHFHLTFLHRPTSSNAKLMYGLLDGSALRWILPLVSSLFSSVHDPESRVLTRLVFLFCFFLVSPPRLGCRRWTFGCRTKSTRTVTCR